MCNNCSYEYNEEYGLYQCTTCELHYVDQKGASYCCRNSSKKNGAKA